ncbi:hypothetical protein LTS15_002074 [Exophiala xenobiotica]|nr:hypothetical protein LTS15_002074 [Exophiala xenobiotica]
MDHLPTPHSLDLIEIPYLCTEEYDGGDFFAYPRRKHLDEECMRVRGQFNGHPQAEIEAFLQTWLFYGTLHEVFRAARLDVNLKDFVRLNDAKRQVLTTAKLPDLVKTWKETEDGIVLGDPEQESRKCRILSVLVVVLDWIGRYGSIESCESARRSLLWALRSGKHFT